jgi:hypothetical protein
VNTFLKPPGLCAVVGCVVAAIFLLARQRLLPHTEHQARPQGKIAQQIHLSQQMDRLSRELETRDKLKEWPDARRTSSHSGYVLVATTMGNVGGNGYEEYFALFSEHPAAKNRKSPALIGWAMVPAPLRFEDTLFAVETDAAGEKILRLSLIDTRKESFSAGESIFFEYPLPGQDAWGIELSQQLAHPLVEQPSPGRGNP